MNNLFFLVPFCENSPSSILPGPMVLAFSCQASLRKCDRNPLAQQIECVVRLWPVWPYRQTNETNEQQLFLSFR